MFYNLLCNFNKSDKNGKITWPCPATFCYLWCQILSIDFLMFDVLSSWKLTSDDHSRFFDSLLQVTVRKINKVDKSVHGNLLTTVRLKITCHAITQCGYLPPCSGEVPALSQQNLVLDLATSEGCKAELAWWFSWPGVWCICKQTTVTFTLSASVKENQQSINV